MLTTPLSDDEYDQLDDMLSEISQDAMDVSALEGLLTALVIGPRAPAQEVWLPKVWGGGQAAGTDAATALVLRHFEYMRKWMMQDPGSFEPIYECGGAWSAQAWTAGFETGIALDADGWAPLRAAHPEWLAPFQREGDDWERAVTPAVIQINAFWHTAAPKAAKVGRNDPCPCGSGKKYKKCCGDGK
ncbi:MAG TPA: UPF0149 family protein [Duganella sp.]|jgi:uncharacterized protein